MREGADRNWKGKQRKGIRTDQKRQIVGKMQHDGWARSMLKCGKGMQHRKGYLACMRAGGSVKVHTVRLMSGPYTLRQGKEQGEWWRLRTKNGLLWLGCFFPSITLLDDAHLLGCRAFCYSSSLEMPDSGIAQSQKKKGAPMVCKR